MKHEITSFRNKYIGFLKSKKEYANICNWLENAVDFEKPDGYYYDSDSKLLLIFEHFDIDCSERLRKKDKPLGSILRKNSADINQEVHKEIQASGEHYESTKVIEQGYCKQDGNNKTFYIGQDGDKYRNNYINNFSESFETHSKKINDYKDNVIDQLKIQPLEVKIIFLVEDKTVLGSYYMNNKNWFESPVILTNTLQFQELINKSNIDYVISGREQDGITCIGYKGDTTNKVDLSKQEFFVFPAIISYTASKKM